MNNIEDKIQRWKSALAIKDLARSALTKAECEVSNSANALKNALVPEDYKVGELFCVPYEKEFIQIKILTNNEAEISVRKLKK